MTFMTFYKHIRIQGLGLDMLNPNKAGLFEGRFFWEFGVKSPPPTPLPLSFKFQEELI